MHSEKVSGPGKVSFYGWFFFTHLAQLSKFSSWLAVPPIIITQTNHALVIQIFNLFHNIIIIYSFFFLISYIFISLRGCSHAFYCFVLSLSDYLMHVLTSDVVLLLPFLDLFNIYNFFVILFDNDRE